MKLINDIYTLASQLLDSCSQEDKNVAAMIRHICELVERGDFRQAEYLLSLSAVLGALESEDAKTIVQAITAKIKIYRERRRKALIMLRRSVILAEENEVFSAAQKNDNSPETIVLAAIEAAITDWIDNPGLILRR